MPKFVIGDYIVEIESGEILKVEEIFVHQFDDYAYTYRVIYSDDYIVKENIFSRNHWLGSFSARMEKYYRLATELEVLLLC